MDNEFYKSLIDSVHDGIYHVDRDRKITFWNKSAERITGYSREAVLQSRCHENILKHIDDQGRELCLKGCPTDENTDRWKNTGSGHLFAS